MATLRLWHVLVFVGFVVVAASESDAWEAESLGDVCDEGGSQGEECAVHLRQLRAGQSRSSSLPALEDDDLEASKVNEADIASVAGELQPDTDMDAVAGELLPDAEPSIFACPGGWGEEADCVKAGSDDNPLNSTLEANAAWHGSCAVYGCSGRFHRYWRCQCNYNCYRYHNCCYDYGSRCRKKKPHHQSGGSTFLGEVRTVFHATSPWAAQQILKYGFRLGSQGWCGGGIYFAESPEATRTKAIGPDSHQGFIIEAKVAMGRVKYMPQQCDRSMTAGRLHSENFDSIKFNPGDGTEWVVYSPTRVLSTKAYR